MNNNRENINLESSADVAGACCGLQFFMATREKYETALKEKCAAKCMSLERAQKIVPDQQSETHVTAGKLSEK